MLFFQVGRALVHELPVPFIHQVLASGGSAELLAESCWSIGGWPDGALPLLLLDLLHTNHAVRVQRQALLMIQDPRGRPVAMDVASWVPRSLAASELV